MSDYIRSTRECAFENLNPSLGTAIRAYIEKHQPGLDPSSALLCCETVSTKQKKGLFGGKAEVILSAALIIPPMLIMASAREKEVPGVLSTPLRAIQVTDYEKSDLYRLVPDTGLDISGLQSGNDQPGSLFIGLGPEAAAQKLRSLLKEAAAKA